MTRPPAAPPRPPWAPFLPLEAVPATLAPEQQALLGIGLVLARAPLAARTAAFASATKAWRAEAAHHYRGRRDPAGPEPLPRPLDAVHTTTHREIAEAPSLGEAASPSGGAGPAAVAPLPKGATSRTAGAPRRAAPSTPPDSPTSPADPLPEAGATTSSALAASAAGSRRGPPPADRAADAPVFGEPFLEVHSSLCGVLFLINALRATGGFTRVAELPPPIALASGWGWLELVARELLGREGASEDPLWRVLALLDGRPPTEALRAKGLPAPLRSHLRSELPPLRKRLRATLAAAGARAGLPGVLLARDGRIQASPTHVDVRMGLDAITLPVRLSGLDANPGWVPELARVVTFHFD